MPKQMIAAHANGITIYDLRGGRSAKGAKPGDFVITDEHAYHVRERPNKETYQLCPIGIDADDIRAYIQKHQIKRETAMAHAAWREFIDGMMRANAVALHDDALRDQLLTQDALVRGGL